MSRHDTLPKVQNEPETDPWASVDWGDGDQGSTTAEVETTPVREGLIKKLGNGVTSRLEARKQRKLAARYENVRNDVGAEESGLEPGSMDWSNARALEGQAASVGAAEAEYTAAKVEEAKYAALVAQEEAKLVNLQHEADRAALDGSDASRSFTAKEAADQAVYVAHLKAKQPEFAAKTDATRLNHFDKTELAGVQQAYMADAYGYPGLRQQHEAEQARRESGTW